MEDGATLAAVEADVDEAVELGVTGTPTFFINGRVIVGAQPTEVFVEAIERAAVASR
jgi:predicted DsbA family dithiol-disulfide isomerase